MLVNCRSLNDGLACVDSALRGCQALIDKDIIKKVRLFMRSFRQIDLCTKPTYQEGTILLSLCFFKLSHEALKISNSLCCYVVQCCDHFTNLFSSLMARR